VCDSADIIAVVGCGTMGAGIAQVAAAAGHRVQLHDARPDAVEQAIAGISAALRKRVAQGKLAAIDCDATLDRLSAAAAVTDLAAATIVVEAVVEDLAVKQRLFAEIEGVVAPDAILASNTSSLSITAIAAALRRPGRMVGMHFFNPVPVMALVEVVSGAATAPEVADMVAAYAVSWGKTPVRARSTPGFIVNRVARPFYAEALRVLGEGGADAATLDAVMRESGGFRMGPFELMDLIGHDVNFAVTRSVWEAFYHDPRFTPSVVQQELVAAGFLGRKTGRGFYRYGQGSERPVPESLPRGPEPQHVAGDLLADGRIEIDGATAVALTDGRTATERMAVDGGLPLVLVDLALDFASATRVALVPADQAAPEHLARAAGLFQAQGKQVSRLDDVPGMLVMRTVCMLANEAADAVSQGVADAAAIDTAMGLAVNFPRGPLAWADAIGLKAVTTVLANLAAAYGEERYRTSPLLRRRLLAGGSLA
jgi:3-hydroxybutyryl-CoA dehydrogenase